MRALAALTLLMSKVVRRLHMLWLMPLFRRRALRFRWSIETIMEHEARLYPPEARTPRDRLEADRALLKAQQVY